MCETIISLTHAARCVKRQHGCRTVHSIVWYQVTSEAYAYCQVQSLEEAYLQGVELGQFDCIGCSGAVICCMSPHSGHACQGLICHTVGLCQLCLHLLSQHPAQHNLLREWSMHQVRSAHDAI